MQTGRAKPAHGDVEAVPRDAELRFVFGRVEELAVKGAGRVVRTRDIRIHRRWVGALKPDPDPNRARRIRIAQGRQSRQALKHIVGEDDSAGFSEPRRQGPRGGHRGRGDQPARAEDSEGPEGVPIARFQRSQFATPLKSMSPKTRLSYMNVYRSGYCRATPGGPLPPPH